MVNARRRLDAALPGAERAPASVELRGAQRDDRALRRRARSPPTRRSPTGRSATTSSSRSTTRVEHAIGVAGQAGNLDGGRDPAAARSRAERRRDYPHAAAAPQRAGRSSPRTPRGELGWHPFPAPAAINSRPYNGNPECTYCGFCTHNGCYRDAKGSTDANVIRAGRGDRAAARRDGRPRHAHRVRRRRPRDRRDLRAGRARAVLPGARSSCSRRSPTRTRGCSCSRARPRIPHGLANGSDQVGRHYMAHVTPFAFGRFPGGASTSSRASGRRRLRGRLERRQLRPRRPRLHRRRPARRLARVQADRVRQLPAAARRAALRLGWKAWLAANAQSVGALERADGVPALRGQPPRPRSARARSARPARHAHHAPRARERAARRARSCAERQDEWLRAAGATEVWHAPRPVRRGAALLRRHAHGRRSRRPRSSTASASRTRRPTSACSATSVFPTSGGHNPTLTLQALASADGAAAGRRAGTASPPPRRSP